MPTLMLTLMLTLTLTLMLTLTLVGVDGRIYRLAHVPVAEYNVGDTARLQCQLGDSSPKPRIAWHFGGRRAQPKAFVEADTLVVPHMVPEDSGLYTCTASNVLGEIVASVRVLVRPVLFQSGRIVRRVTDASAGLNATLDCTEEAEAGGGGGGELPAAAAWSREDEQMPVGRHLSLSNNSLLLVRLTSRDSGAYACDSVLPSGGRLRILHDLRVQPLLPAFNNRPGLPTASSASFLRLRRVSLPYLGHRVQLALRPRRSDGLILFSGSAEPGQSLGEHVSLHLSDSFVVGRFNLGSGSAVLRSARPVRLLEWTSVTFERDGRRGRLTVGQSTVGAEAPGGSSGLTLPSEFFLGCAPPSLVETVLSGVGVDSCYSGDVAKFAVGDSVIRIGENLAASACLDCVSGVQPADVCAEGVCRNGATCRPDHVDGGVACHCAPEFAGRFCERPRERCSSTTCGLNGRCTEVPDGVRCSCAIGMSGSRCQSGSAISFPRFSGSSFVVLTARRDDRGTELSLTVRPISLSRQSLLLFSGVAGGRVGDFQAIELTDGRPTVRLRLEGQRLTLASRRSLALNAWNRLTLRRSLATAALIINGTWEEEIQLPRSSVSSVSRSGSTPLFLGGADASANLPKPLVGLSGFVGCLREFEELGRVVDVGRESLRHSGVLDCSKLGCSAGLCGDGVCREEGDGGFSCDCADGVDGRFCRRRVTPCDDTVCLNSGRCRGLDRSRFECDCRIGFGGTHCQEVTPLHQSARFNGRGYAELPNSFVTSAYGQQQRLLTVQFWLRTEASEGLLLWHGQPADELADGQDFLSVVIDNGQLVARRNCSGESLVVATRSQVGDNRSRQFRVVARRRRLEIFVDGRLDGFAEAPADSTGRFVARGSVFVGDLPRASLLLRRPPRPLVGCLWRLRLQNSAPVNFLADAIAGFNAQPCGEEREAF